MPWQQVTITTSKELAPSFEEILENNGALSVTFTDALNQPIYEPPLETTPLWEEVLVTGLFDEQHDLSRIEQIFTESVDNSNSWKIHLERLENQVWERLWLEHFQPIKFGDDFWVCSTEHSPPEPDATILWLDPGLAFGTGTHPTTFLCLQWIDQQNMQDKQLIDYGCGSGILGIAGLLMGAKQVVGVDIDPQALLATTDNAERNGLPKDAMPVYLPGDAPLESADIVLANILAGPLAELSENLSSLTKAGGQRCLSGILAIQAESVIEAYAQWFDFDPIAQQDEWVRLTARKRG
jgi:ribosomal protein L11 methyltransferase